MFFFKEGSDVERKHKQLLEAIGSMGGRKRCETFEFDLFSACPPQKKCLIENQILDRLLGLECLEDGISKLVLFIP